jgi:hypothetical protein
MVARHQPDRHLRIAWRGEDMTWLLLTSAGLVAETAVIVALGRRATAGDDTEQPLLRPSHRAVPGSRSAPD